jgi:glutathione peroxidase-family protein
LPHCILLSSILDAGFLLSWLVWWVNSGLTRTNYKELGELYSKYKESGFEILAFPSNQFGGQEPGSNEQIKETACSRFKAEFPIFAKVQSTHSFSMNK